MTVIDELVDVTARRYHIVKDQILKAMQNYDEASKLMEMKVMERDEFTAALFRFLSIWVGYDYQPDGSFTKNGANKAFNNEVQPEWGDLYFTFNVMGRFERLEEGVVNFHWIWDNWLRDVVWEPWFKEKWQPIIGYRDLATLRGGPPPTTASRPYVGRIMEVNAPKHGEAVKRSLKKGLEDMGLNVRVSKLR